MLSEFSLRNEFCIFWFQSVLLPDGTPDVHFRTACGGQKLRDIMLDGNMELYGPYVSPSLSLSLNFHSASLQPTFETLKYIECTLQ